MLLELSDADYSKLQGWLERYCNYTVQEHAIQKTVLIEVADKEIEAEIVEFIKQHPPEDYVEPYRSRLEKLTSCFRQLTK